MQMYCPVCGNMLLVGKIHQDMKLYCQTCPYMYQITSEMAVNSKIEAKKQDDILGGEDAWANVAKTEAICPKCAHNVAYYTEMQLRSADEPMTQFNKCVKCGYTWREG